MAPRWIGPKAREGELRNLESGQVELSREDLVLALLAHSLGMQWLIASQQQQA